MSEKGAVRGGEAWFAGSAVFVAGQHKCFVWDENSNDVPGPAEAFGPDAETAIARAHLIAAAPEMLAVLQKLVHDHDNATASWEEEVGYNFDMARDAISRATGSPQQTSGDE